VRLRVLWDLLATAGRLLLPAPDTFAIILNIAFVEVEVAVVVVVVLSVVVVVMVSCSRGVSLRCAPAAAILGATLAFVFAILCATPRA